MDFIINITDKEIWNQVVSSMEQVSQNSLHSLLIISYSYIKFLVCSKTFGSVWERHADRQRGLRDIESAVLIWVLMRKNVWKTGKMCVVLSTALFISDFKAASVKVFCMWASYYSDCLLPLVRVGLTFIKLKNWFHRRFIFKTENWSRHRKL